MFFAEDRIEHMRAMILATTEKDRRAALKKLLPMQRADFVGLSRPWGRCPSPSAPSILRCMNSSQARGPAGRDRTASKTPSPARPSSRRCARCWPASKSLHEANPMLGLRGCRLGISFPEITEMQCAP